MKALGILILLFIPISLLFNPFTACNSKKQQIIKIDSTQINIETDLANKYVILYETLEHYFKKYNFKHSEIVDSLEEKKNPALVKRLKKLRSMTHFTNKKISLVKVFLYSNIGGEYDTIQYSVKKPLEVARVEAYLINLNKKGEAYELVRILNEYTDYLNKEFKDVNPDGFISMTKLPQNNPMLKNFPELQKRDFVESKFRGASVVLALATLTQMQNQVLIYESQILEILLPQYKKGMNN